MRRLLVLSAVVGLLALVAYPAAATPNGSILPPTITAASVTVAP